MSSSCCSDYFWSLFALRVWRSVRSFRFFFLVLRIRIHCCMPKCIENLSCSYDFSPSLMAMQESLRMSAGASFFMTITVVSLFAWSHVMTGRCAHVVFVIFLVHAA